MKFSIVTPSYNHDKYIETTIKSVINQTYENFEYFIMDGGSTDNTVAVVNKYTDKVNKFISEKDKGQSDAINKGFRFATGDIYAYINSDDYYFPYALEEVAKIFQENPDIDVVYGDCVFVDEKEQFLRYFTEVEPFDKYRLTTCTDFIMQPSCFWRKEAYDAMNGFNQDLHYGFDWDLWARMANTGYKFYYLQKPLAVNREFETTKTSSGSFKRLKELLKITKNNKNKDDLAVAAFGFAHGTLLQDMEDGDLKDFLIELTEDYSKENADYTREHFEDKKLYGIYPHSQYVKKQSTFNIPWYNEASKAVVDISVFSVDEDKIQEVDIIVNGEFAQKVKFDTIEKIIEIDLENVSKVGYFTFEFNFKYDYLINDDIAAQINYLQIRNEENIFAQKGDFKVYFNTGSGFHEDECFITKIVGNNSIYEVDLQNKDLLSLRIDPMPSRGFIEIHKINLISSGLDCLIALEDVHSNATLFDDTKLLFIENDPMIIIDCSHFKGLEKLVFSCEYLSGTEDIYHNIVSMNLDKINSRTRNVINSKNYHIKHLESIVVDKENHIKNLESIIDNLNNSTFRGAIKKQLKCVIGEKYFNILKHIKNNPHALEQGLKILLKDGFKGLNQKIANINGYSSYDFHNKELTEKIKKELYNFPQKPLISIIMPVYNVDSKWLDLAIKSIEAQWYENWELCIADDKSTKNETIEYLKNINNPKIKIKFLEKNLNISGASNEALTLATGEYVALMDNDDEITSDALYEVVKAINDTGAELIYSDEDSLTSNGHFTNPHFKPNYSPDLLLTHNYITHFSVIQKNLIKEIGGFRSLYDGAQDHDLFLRLTEITDNIYHIPKVLYHWRMIPTSTNSNPYAKPEAMENARKMLLDTLQRRKINGTVHHMDGMAYFFRVKREIRKMSLVSIIIPFKDKPELLKMCIESILEKSTYNNFEIIGISNNSTEQSTFDEMKRLGKLDNRIKFYEYNIPFNYSQINNYAVNNYTQGEHIILLNNDIEIISPDWIESMLEQSQREDIGCVGAKLYYPDDTIQHAGVILGIGGVAGHAHKCFPKNNVGYFNRAMIIQNLSAVTAACLMVKKNIYNELDGLDEKNLTVAFNDVDFCLRVQEKGYRNIFTPFAQAYHHESISRGYEDSVEKIKRFKSEESYMKQRHKHILENGDPYYNPNLTLDREDFSLR